MSDTRPWRTNVGLRLTHDLGQWVEEHCKRENRTYANFVETLIMRERERLNDAPSRAG